MVPTRRGGSAKMLSLVDSGVEPDRFLPSPSHGMASMSPVRPATAVLTVALVALAVALGAGVAVGELSVSESDPPSDHALGGTADLGTAASATNATLAIEHDQRTVAAAMTAGDDGDRGALSEAYLEEASTALSALLDADAETAAGLANGSVDTGEAARALTITGAEAAAWERALERHAEVAGVHDGTDLAAASHDAAERFDLVDGPIREVLLAASTDPASQTTVAASVGEDGLRLGGVGEGQLHHETIRFDRLPDGTDGIDGLDEAAAIVADTYPTSNATTATRDLGGGHYVVERTLPDGTVRAHVSGASAAVAASTTSVWLDGLVADTTATETADGIVVTVERADAGALWVTAQDADSDEPAAGTAYLRHDGTWTPMGSLDDAGQAWSADPGGPIDVRIQTPEGTVTVELTA